MFRHIVFSLHIYNTLVSLSTDTTRLYNIVVKYYHTIVYSTGKNCIVSINKYKGKFHFTIYFKNAVVFIVSSTAGYSCCSVLCLFRIFISKNQILYCITILSHCICEINKHKGKRHYIDEFEKHYLFITSSTAGSTESYTIFLSDPNTVSRNLYRIYLRLFQVTYRLSVLQSLCHILLAFKTETHFIKG